MRTYRIVPWILALALVLAAGVNAAPGTPKKAGAGGGSAPTVVKGSFSPPYTAEAHRSCYQMDCSDEDAAADPSGTMRAGAVSGPLLHQEPSLCGWFCVVPPWADYSTGYGAAIVQTTLAKAIQGGKMTAVFHVGSRHAEMQPLSSGSATSWVGLSAAWGYYPDSVGRSQEWRVDKAGTVVSGGGETVTVTVDLPALPAGKAITVRASAGASTFIFGGDSPVAPMAKSSVDARLTSLTYEYVLA